MYTEKNTIEVHFSVYRRDGNTFWGSLIMSGIDFEIGFKAVVTDQVFRNGLPEDPFTLRKFFKIEISREGNGITLSPREYRLFAGILYPSLKKFHEITPQHTGLLAKILDRIVRRPVQKSRNISYREVYAAVMTREVCLMLTHPKFGTNRRFYA